MRMSVRFAKYALVQNAGCLCCASCIALALTLAIPPSVSAQTMPGGTKKSGSVEGSPLDTILSTRLWTTPPPAKDFVRETRPDSTSLDYTPLHGEEPNRPKPRDEKNVKALQAELEQDIKANEQRAKSLGGVSKPDSAIKPAASRHVRKPGSKGAAASAR